MERKIGEIFEYNGEWYQCIVGNGCENCAFNERKCYTFTDNNDPIGDCCADRRKDNKDVIFKKLEKVGKPYTITVNKTVQNYILETEVSVPPKDVFILIDNKLRLIAIEIKQTKEDMEENKPKEDNPLTKVIYNYVNGKISDKELIKTIKEMPDEYPYNKYLKPFNLEAAKAGKPVCTRDGHKARIICFDYKGDGNAYPILALISTSNLSGVPSEIISKYTKDGKYAKYNNVENNEDLMMLPEKKEGWINVKKDASLFKSKEEAERNCTKDYAPVRVEFEI